MTETITTTLKNGIELNVHLEKLSTGSIALRFSNGPHYILEIRTDGIIHLCPLVPQCYGLKLEPKQYVKIIRRGYEDGGESG